MNGNRGAKGSIKDRLISMLYRLRYKKKKLKESDYKIHKKEKQQEYLYNLENFKEKENINMLDDKDQEQLDKINYNANFKIKKKKGVNEVELKLDSIEYKTSELDEKVEIKKEISKTKNEITILKEVDSFVKKSLENIQDIQDELDIIKIESKEKNKETIELEERYIILKKKINKLKKQYDVIKDKYDLSEFAILASIKLIDNIEDYKSVAKLNEVEMMLKVCKKEISKIASITVVVEENKKVGTSIDKIKKDQQNVKVKFNKTKEKMNNIFNWEEELVREINYQQEIVDDMYKKASFYEEKINKQIEVIGHRKIFSSFFRIAGGILTLPFSGKHLFGVALGSTLINKGLKELNKKLETREKIVVNYKYEDISKQIEQVKDKVEYTNLILTDSLNEICKIKNNFKNIYAEYNNILPEYNSTLERLNDLELKIKEHQIKLNKMDKKLSKEKEINKQKIKKLEKNK